MNAIKTAIQNNLQNFAGGSLTEAAIHFWQTLGYDTSRRAPLADKTWDAFKALYPLPPSFSEERALVAQWRSCGILFQLSDSEVSSQIDCQVDSQVNSQHDFAMRQVDNTLIESFLFMAIALSQGEYPRTALSRITREVNKIFPMPVMLTFKHGDTITLTMIDRRINKQQSGRDVPEKVTLIKDISIANPRWAHIEILFDLSFNALRKRGQVSSVAELRRAWRETLDTRELNKRFYRDISAWYSRALTQAASSHSAREENGDTAKNLIRLLTRLMFIWFIKEKGLGSENFFDAAFLKIFDLFRKYKFTVEENTPLEEDIALDPELLGRVFESLLATYNENKVSARKASGSFYTPREIVDYMVKEALRGYLCEAPPGSAGISPAIEQLLDDTDNAPDLSDEERRTLISAIKNCKILDPACGSGAFLIGALHRLTQMLRKLDPDNTDDYGRKVFLIENCLFGIDIQEIAVQIVRMRFFISLISEQMTDRAKENLGVRSLPNLEKNFVAANALIDFEKFPRGFAVVIGNPPYGASYPAEQKKLFRAQYQSAKTIPGVQKGSLDTFSLFIECGFNMLRKNGCLTFIVPIAFTSSDSMTGLHTLLETSCGTMRISSYAVRPQPVFPNAVVDVCIVSFCKDMQPVKQVFTTKLNRKDKFHSLNYVMDHLTFVDSYPFKLNGRYPKIGLEIEKSILKKMFLQKETLSDYKRETGRPLYYRSVGGRYYKVITNYSTGASTESVLFLEKEKANAIGALLSTSLFFWYYQIFSDNHSLTRYEIERFPIPKLDSRTVGKLEKWYAGYLSDIEKNMHIRLSSGKSNYHVSQFREYKIRKSKHHIDQIDDLICPLYGLTHEETAFIKNYEIAFRGEE
jgi:type I restriction-modification system DNA methylase subunit